MRTRLIAAVVAVVLAGLGTVVLLGYVAGADARALQGTRTVNVLVLTASVPKDTPAKDLVGVIATKAIPAVAALAGRVTSLDQLRGKTTSTDLLIGEQLVRERFTDPATAKSTGGPQIPPGMQEVTIRLEPQRALGGLVAVGDTVGMLISLPGPPARTHLTLHKLQVIGVQGAPVSADGAGGSATGSATTGTSPTPAPAPTMPAGDLLITLAVTAPVAERVVFGAEFGTLWLSKEPADAKVDGSSIVTSESVLK